MEKEKKSEEFVDQKPILAWDSPEYVIYKRSGSWYVIFLLVAILIASLLIWQGIWSGAVLALVAAATFVFITRSKPRNVKCAIYPQGVVLNHQVYHFREFKSFWITPGELPKLRLQRLGRIAGQVSLPLGNILPDEIINIIGTYLPEEDDKGEDLLEMINRWTRF